MDKPKASAVGAAVRWAIAAAAVMIFLLYVPAPFIVFQPGLIGQADELVAGAKDKPQAEWMIATVYMARSTNYWTALQGMWRADREVHAKKAVLRGQDITEYALRMNVLMEGSQSDAIEAAYPAAGVAYEQVPRALLVAGAGATSAFEAGDRISAIGGEAVNGAADAVRLLARQSDGPVTIEVLRGGERLSVEVRGASPELGELSTRELPRLLGGVELTETRAIRPAVAADAVAIDAGEVGGPSAGLLFALYIYDLLTEGELGGSRRIVASGTIAPDGAVGAVGGIGMKVIAADRAGADMFIVPAGNDKEAKAMAQELGTRMRIVPVRSLQEAIDACLGG